MYRRFQPWYGGHLIFGLHYYSFDYIVSSILARTLPESGPSLAVTIGFVYLLLALKRVYRQGYWKTFGKTVVLFAAVGVAEMLMVGGSVMLALRMAH